MIPPSQPSGSIHQLHTSLFSPPARHQLIFSGRWPVMFFVANHRTKNSRCALIKATVGNPDPFVEQQMDKIGVWMTCPMSNYLQDELAKRFNLFKSWEIPSKTDFFHQQSQSIKAVVGSGIHGADSGLIDSLPNLEIISSHGSGLDKIDLFRCKEKGIRVTYTPDSVTDEVADLAILLILATLRRICVCDQHVRNGLWKQQDFPLTTKFSGKSVGIIGLGRIGSAIAKRVEQFGCNISYYSRSEKPNLSYKFCGNATDLASNCEILVVACSLTESTRGIINREVITAYWVVKGF